MGGITGILVEALPLLLQAAQSGVQVWDVVGKIQSAHASSNDPTSAEWQAVNDAIAALRRQLHTDPPQS